MLSELLIYNRSKNHFKTARVREKKKTFNLYTFDALKLMTDPARYLVNMTVFCD